MKYGAAFYTSHDQREKQKKECRRPCDVEIEVDIGIGWFDGRAGKNMQDLKQKSYVLKVQKEGKTYNLRGGKRTAEMNWMVNHQKEQKNKKLAVASMDGEKKERFMNDLNYILT